MADVKELKIGNMIYNIKDKVARDDIANFEEGLELANQKIDNVLANINYDQANERISLKGV